MIKNVAQIFLDIGKITKGFKISQYSPEIPASIIKCEGSLLIEELSSESSYIVMYEELTPLHGSGSNSIYIITSIKTQT